MLNRDACLVATYLAIAYLAGCSDTALVQKYAPATEVSIARNYAEMLRQGRVEEIKRDIDPKLAASGEPDVVEKLSQHMPNAEPRSVKTVGASVRRYDEITDATISFEYEFPAQWMLVTVSTQTKAGSIKLTDLRVVPLSDSLERLNRFTLSGKGPIQYLSLIWVIGISAFVLYTFVICARSSEMRPKWFWLAVILLGVGGWAVNWQTGSWDYHVLSFHIPCIDVHRAPYGPWIIGAYLPVGAFAYYHRRWMNRVEGKWIPETRTPVKSEESSGQISSS